MCGLHYRKNNQDCPICSCDEFVPGFIDLRLKKDYWPEGRRNPDFDAMRCELKDNFGIDVGSDDVEEHWNHHISIRMDEYRERARKNAEHGIAETRYDPEMLDDT
ncbi:hypothetical protein AArcSl_2303 [Halalkaliarchaeum desulfuricum]|uniref:Uncharacterized protein n=1 Tax=Halalkaliarchaeum desulfuricum TaxID=2055893 RepID=A0A343TLF4_9EURY|nr:hypothetical protein [Halalkaliarchaeum desulfuricum]AUX09926.1 hypothetical protein AArcSl_2303 [Halalkaliarchaeum desulfuricum]